jgi:DNA-binding response OmpR family regulator
MKTLLLVEDERDILENNRRFFKAEGYRVLTAENLVQAREHLFWGGVVGFSSIRSVIGAIVLDILLPDGNGLDLLRELRESGGKTPVIMLTAWGKSSDVARGLKLGANDYMSKPFTYEVLQARVEAMFRNVEQMPEVIEKGALTLRPAPMTATLNGKDLMLSRKEFALLMFFIQNENRIMGAEYLYENVWGSPMAGDDNAIKVTLSKLRKKISGSGYTIAAEYGEGYRFETD